MPPPGQVRPQTTLHPTPTHIIRCFVPFQNPIPVLNLGHKAHAAPTVAFASVHAYHVVSFHVPYRLYSSLLSLLPSSPKHLPIYAPLTHFMFTATHFVSTSISIKRPAATETSQFVSWRVSRSHSLSGNTSVNRNEPLIAVWPFPAAT